MKLPFDPRIFQICFLGLLLFFGVALRDFGVSWNDGLVVLGAGVASQLFWVWMRRATFDSLLSALISIESVLLLCRAESVVLLGLAVGVSIFSKYLLRHKGKHFFNPTNFGILIVILVTDRAWVSPGQWGSDIVVAAWIGALGLGVLAKSARIDTAIFFLVAWGGLLGARVAYLGQSIFVWRHQLTSGTLLVFALFMITDPRSTPDDRRGRFVFSVLVALLAYYLRFGHYVAAAPLWALFFISPLTTVIDRIWRQERFQWRNPHAPNRTRLNFSPR